MPVQRARLAQLNRDWRTAIRLWQASVDRTPNDPDAALGYIAALVATGGFEKAWRMAQLFRSEHPQNENGPMILARIAEARGHREKAIAWWRSVRELAPLQREALSRLGSLLLEENLLDEARVCADLLRHTYPHRPEGFLLSAQLIEREHGFEQARREWEAAVQRFGDDKHVLHTYSRLLVTQGAFEEASAVASKLRKLDLQGSFNLQGSILAKRSPLQDHTGFWEHASRELPDSADLIRKLLHAALSARNTQVAERAFARLRALDRFTIGDAGVVFGLGLAQLAAGNRAEARQQVRAYLRQMRGLPGYRAAALRLDRLVLSAFPRRGSAAQLASRPGRFSRIVAAADLGPEASGDFDRMSALELKLRRSAAHALLDTDLDPEPARRLVSLVRAHLWEGRPFSLIRLGDGEANALTYPAAFSSDFASDSAEREKVWWGRTLGHADREDLALHVRQAIENADALGIPTTTRLLRDIRLDTGRALAASRSGRGILAVLTFLERELERAHVERRCIVSAHIHQDLERWNLYPTLFKDVGDAVLISCHPGLPELLRHRFGLATLKHVIIPPGDTMLEIQRRALTDAEMPPGVVRRALKELGDWPRGRLVLVGAGYAGKTIIDHAKRRGGIALDLGSIFDRWMGVHSRSFQDLP